MSAEVLRVAQSRVGGQSPSHLNHIFCDCTGPDVALCGRDISDMPFVEWLIDEDACVVCLDLELQPCECTP